MDNNSGLTMFVPWTLYRIDEDSCGKMGYKITKIGKPISLAFDDKIVAKRIYCLFPNKTIGSFFEYSPYTVFVFRHDINTDIWFTNLNAFSQIFSSLNDNDGCLDLEFKTCYCPIKKAKAFDEYIECFNYARHKLLNLNRRYGLLTKIDLYDFNATEIAHMYTDHFIDAVNYSKGKIMPVNSTMPSICNVFYNEPHTIVKWSDGTETVVGCANGEEFDKKLGLSVAIAKKYFEVLGFPYPRAALKRVAENGNDQTAKTKARREYKAAKKAKNASKEQK